MSNFLKKGAAWLASKLATKCAEEVLYARGAFEATPKAVIGRTEFNLDDGSGAIDRFETVDFLIRAAEIVLDGAETFPARGDTITHAGITYTVDAPPGQEVWQHDGFRDMLRIHTWQRESE